MDDEIAKNKPNIHAEDHSIAIGEINITGTVTGDITIGHTIVQPAPSGARLRHELGILLKNVRTTWIQGVLEKSVHEAALLELGLELREEAVDNPWRMVIEGPDQTRQTLPRGRRIKDIFDEANRLLLILGEPGSGKTTTLLQLARDLIAEVDVSAFTQPVPVILNLSTWTNKAQPLAEWLVSELNSKYRLPKKDGQRWLKERRIIPLLDGLDEVRAENRAACVEKINQLVTDYGLQGIVVCSRIKDYTALNVRLAFYRAIYLQPLAPNQIDAYLRRAGERLTGLRTALQKDKALRSLATSPLILNIMSLAYQNTSTGRLTKRGLDTDEARRRHLFDTYIARMLNRKSESREYDDEQTKQCLSWLAQNMRRHNQEIFLIEALQPSWLTTRGWRQLYFLGSRLITGLILGFSVNGYIRVSTNNTAGLFLGLIAGLVAAFSDLLRFEWFLQRREIGKKSTAWWSVINIIVVTLIVGLMGRLVETGERVGMGMVFGLLCGFFFGLRGSRENGETDIETVEVLRWSWRKAANGGLIGLMLGMIFGMILGLVSEDIPAMVICGGLNFLLIGVALNGFRREIIETKSVPNEGIWLSVKNAVVGGLSLALGVGVITELSTWVSVANKGASEDRLIAALNTVLILGLLGALWYGGRDIIQHVVLRIILLIQGHTPANYVRFLDYAVDRIFLQKVGGGYRFIHRLLLEHFAEMDPLLP